MKEVMCVLCSKGCMINVDSNNNVSNYDCEKGIEYALNEINNPKRMITFTVEIDSKVELRCPCRTSSPIDKALVFDCVEHLKKIKVKAPIKIGDVIIENICSSGIDIIATKNIKE